MDLPGLIVVLTCSVVMILLGFWLAHNQRGRRPMSKDGSGIKDLLLADRSIGLVVGTITLVSTEVGGAFIMGTSQQVFDRGFVWCLAPICYSISMSVNSIFFVNKVRNKGYITLVDVLQKVNGRRLGALIYLPSFVGDICWNAATLNVLGITISLVTDTNYVATIIVSSVIVVIYTLIGGMYAVSYTDVIQFVFIIIGLLIVTPWVITSPKLNYSEVSVSEWIGSVGNTPSSNWVVYVDTCILIICGGIPWQPYYQRVLSLKSSKHVNYVSFLATVICIVCMIPSVIIGGLSKSINWDNTTHAHVLNDTSMVFPATLIHLTPKWVSLIGLTILSSASMSSLDSSLLAGASFLTHNVYSEAMKQWTKIQRSTTAVPKDRRNGELIVYRVSVICLGALSVLLALYTRAIYMLWEVAAEVGFVVVFPQFFCAVHLPNYTNKGGCVTGALIGIMLRIFMGIEIISIPPISNFVYQLPGLVPTKTIVMLISLMSILIGSFIYRKMTRCKVFTLEHDYMLH